MTQPIVEELDIDSVLWENRHGAHPMQREAVKAMQKGQANAVSHDGYDPRQCRIKRSSCSLRNMLIQMIKVHRRDVRISFKHLPDGRLGVACFAREDKS